MTQTHTAFELAEAFAGRTATEDPDDARDVYQGGVLALPPDGRSYDVKAELERGDGTIVASTANAVLVEMLRAYPALREIAVPDGWDFGDELDGMSLTQLRDVARPLGLKLTAAGLADRIRAARGEVADLAADTTAQGD